MSRNNQVFRENFLKNKANSQKNCTFGQQCAEMRYEMIKNIRQERIHEILNNQNFATVQELSKQLFISESSIRRDLAEMEKKRILKRSYGGAQLIRTKTNVVDFGARSYDYMEAKQAIAAKAAKLIPEGSVVFLDQSSTCYFLAIELMDYTNLTVVSNNLEILSLLSHTGLTVHATGGVISPNNHNCLIGGRAERAFREIYADFMFFSAKAVSDTGVIMDCTQEEIFVRSAMMEHATQKIFLCDSSKKGTMAPFVQCNLGDVDVLICENNAFSDITVNYPKLKTY